MGSFLGRVVLKSATRVNKILLRDKGMAGTATNKIG